MPTYYQLSTINHQLSTINHQPSTINKIKQIENICSQDVGRGIEPLAKFCQGALMGAAFSIAQHPSPHIAILTGFFIPHGTPPAAETDGLIGCAHLAAGLVRAEIPVRLVTDSLCANAVLRACQVAGVPPTINYQPSTINHQPSHVPLDILNVNSNTDSAVNAILNSWDHSLPPVSHVISIERAGPSFDGKVRNMRGNDITAYTAPLHLLFTNSKAISIAIGDGGNELGMGNLPRELVINNIKNGAEIACVIKSDYLIISGVSNWGAFGLLAALSLLRPDWKHGLTVGLNQLSDYQILKTIVDEKLAVDGVTGLPDLSVDGLPLSDHHQILAEILALIVDG
ncbi:MAG: DUF4392 domain-containing protein [Gomphosphaeria aponina SAG 52.96 = DSM 107014]|uniref:DUF4392 domain-containing protein n=1 Tax=Gomphosphaeria aponina SAG 52.96 = DSM 107014 TaxID=1521640 RepID=A0A941JPI4_9CHRO|nr:DUF4392 domain-containing protein [Gomphosphaeria aponina SAG 52.96 = DSM 107014]